MSGVMRRLDALERVAPEDKGPTLIVRRVIRPGCNDDEWHTASAAGQRFNRQPNESSSEFETRVKRALQNLSGVFRVIVNDKENV